MWIEGRRMNDTYLDMLRPANIANHLPCTPLPTTPLLLLVSKMYHRTMVEEQQISAFLEFGKPTFRFRLGDTRARYMRMEACTDGLVDTLLHVH